MKTNEEEEDRRFGEAVRAALPPLPDGFDPARASESFFAALAARNAAAGIRPPDVSDRLAALARKTADSRRPPAAVRRPLRRIAAAAAVAAVAGSAAVALLASTHCGGPRALPSLAPGGAGLAGRSSLALADDADADRKPVEHAVEIANDGDSPFFVETSGATSRLDRSAVRNPGHAPGDVRRVFLDPDEPEETEIGSCPP